MLAKPGETMTEIILENFVGPAGHAADTLPLSGWVEVSTPANDSILLLDRDTQWNQITTLPDREITSVRFPHPLENPQLSETIVETLRTAGFHGPVFIAAPLGELPFDKSNVFGVAPDEIQSQSVRHFGALENPLLLHGITLTDDPKLFLERPDRIHAHPGLSLAAHFAAHHSRRLKCWPSPPLRTQRVRMEGSKLFECAHTLQRWVQELHAASYHWGGILFRNAGTPRQLVHVLHAALTAQICHPESQGIALQIEHSENILVESARKCLSGKPITGAALQRLYDLWLPHLAQSENEALLRILDNSERQICFARMRTETGVEGSPVAQAARRLLGSPESWVRFFHHTRTKRSAQLGLWTPRAPTVSATQYKNTLKRGLELLQATQAREWGIHFFGLPEVSNPAEVLQPLSATWMTTPQEIYVSVSLAADCTAIATAPQWLPQDTHWEILYADHIMTPNPLVLQLLHKPSMVTANYRVCPDQMPSLIDTLEQLWATGFLRVRLELGPHWERHHLKEWVQTLHKIGQRTRKPSQIILGSHDSDLPTLIAGGSGQLFGRKSPQSHRIGDSPFPVGHLDQSRSLLTHHENAFHQQPENTPTEIQKTLAHFLAHLAKSKRGT
jgi:hypothetical protein